MNHVQGKTIRFQHWTSSFDINSEGRHVIGFPEDFPLTVGCNRFSFDRRLTPNYHDYFEISCVCAGTGTFRVGNRDFTIRQGDLVVLGNTEMHTFLTHGHQPVDVISVFFLPELVYRPGGPSMDFEYIRFFFSSSNAHGNYIPAASIDSPGILGLIERMYWDLRCTPAHYRLRVKTSLYEILLILLQYYDRAPVAEESRYDRRQGDVRRLQPVFRLIENGCGERITLEQAADAACMSPQYFCRFFKKVTGSTFMQYLQQTRIDRAKQLMLTSNLSITQVAGEVGFDSLSYFYRVFRQLTLLSPTEFLRKIEGREEAAART